VKALLTIILLSFGLSAYSTSIANPASVCTYGQVRIALPNGGYYCGQGGYPQQNTNCVMCQYYQQQSMMPWYTQQQNPYPFFNPNPTPWWATQGQMYYPNMMYPGAWQYPGMHSYHYNGNGQVYAAKPNIYVSSVNENVKFQLQFTAENPSFLVTTPYLLDDNSWKGKIVDKDRFEVDNIFYDYLFYDVRLDIKKMQFQAGYCADRETVITMMLSDLKELKHSSISLQDFEEHWRVKIPNYPYYCVYPQYNKQLDEAFPVSITPKAEYIRSLYILVPHQETPRISEGQFPPLPHEDSNSFRPSVLIRKELELREWGVAFLASEAILP
jgi:hypothetical protein